MRKLIKIRRDFVRMPVSKKVSFTEDLDASIKGKAVYQSVTDLMVQIVAIKDQIVPLQIEATHGSKEAKAELSKLIAEWNFLTQKLAGSIELIAEDNEAIAIDAGFSVVGEQAKPNIPILQAKSGLTANAIVLRRKREKDAKSYVWQQAKGQAIAPDTQWVQADITSTATVEISGLDAGSYYWFRVAVVTTEGINEFSDPILVLVGKN